MSKQFKPMLAPNESVDLDTVKYPILASYKLDGIRCIFKEGEILSRSLKQIQNKQLREKFEPLRKYSEDNNIILDGEIYAPGIPFQFITSCVMTKDYNDKKAKRSWAEMCYDHCFIISRKEVFRRINFHCFDRIKNDNFNQGFKHRLNIMFEDGVNFLNIISFVEQKTMNSKEDINNYFDQALTEGYEGLILRDPNGKYKYGRGTIKEGLIYKLKPYKTFDAKITGVIQSTVVDPNAEKKTNQLGRSVTSKKKDDRILIEKASAFNVDYEGKELKVVLAMTDEEKEEVWKNRDSYLGKMIEYKGMLVGAKDVPRHPVMLRFREDRD